MDRKIVYISRTPNGTTRVVNYDAGNSAVNTFLWHFDVWDSNGRFSVCSDEQHSKVAFECSKDFYELSKSKDMKKAFNHMGVCVTYDANDIAEID